MRQLKDRRAVDVAALIARIRIRFEREGDRIVAFTIADPDVVVRAKKA